MTTLLIVESPGKVKKIESILGSNYKVIASVGHIMDLERSNMSIEIENNFNPLYHVNYDKKDIVKNIIKNIKDADNILLAADEDREGEMIAWSIPYVLKQEAKTIFQKKQNNIKRIVFNSITKTDLKNAINNPREIDMNMVHAQQARRILDRIVGYELSPLLWGIAKTNLSAGRVQSVVTRIICDREKEIKEFYEQEQSGTYVFHGEFHYHKMNIRGKLMNSQKSKQKNEVAKIENLKIAKTLMLQISNSNFQIFNIKNTTRTQKPQPPFTTSTLQQTAGQKFNFNVKRTMQVAQKLYENGLITYMRTDSTNLSSEAMENIKSFIITNFSEDDYNYHQYHTKNTQEAHEACRVTDVFKTKIEMGTDENKLYNLIWQRTIASQMKPAIYDVIEYDIQISELSEYYFKSISETIQYLGFLKVYNLKDLDMETETETKINELKKPKIGTKIKPLQVKAEIDFERPPARFTETSLVNQLDPKNLNIGRPATYASIISKIQERNYVTITDIAGTTREIINLNWNLEEIKEIKKEIKIGADKKKMVPTDLGIQINGILTKNFPEIMDYKFTAHMENLLDDIALNKQIWYNVLDTFYKNFHPQVIIMRKLRKDYVPTNNVIAILPDTELEICLIKINNKSLLKCGGKKDAIFAEIDCEPDKLTPEYAIELIKEKMKYPKLLGEFESNSIYLKQGKFGFYLNYKNMNIATEQDVTLDTAIKLIEDKLKLNLGQFQNKTHTFHIVNGQYGHYIRITCLKTRKIQNVKIPKSYNPSQLDLEQIKLIIEEHQEHAKKNKFYKK